MKYCKKCLTTTLRPNAEFTNDGVCIPCKYSLIGNQTNHVLKLRALKERIKQATSKVRKKGDYDCIVGVSGGKDSTRQAHWVRDRLGLKPLLVCAAYPPLQMSELGAENLSNLISMGFDLMVVTPAPKTSAKLSLEAFKKFGNLCKSTELSLFSTVPRIAIDLGINLIFWGENPALQVGDSATEGVDEFDGNNLRKSNTLTEGGNDWLFDAIQKEYLVNHYIYPDEIEFNKKKISIFYLGPAWDDWDNEENGAYAALAGLSLRPGEEHITGDISNASMLDEEFTNINMMIKYYKFGFGRATDIVCEKIRNGMITRVKGIELVEMYDGVCSDEIIQKYCKYVGLPVEEFWNDINNKWTNTSLFSISDNERPKRRFKIGVDFND